MEREPQETKAGTAGGGENTDTVTGTEKTFTQEEINKIISARVNETKAKFADYDELKKRLESLETEKKEREEAELTELEKQKKKIDELTQTIEQLEGFKLEVEKTRLELEEEAEKEMETLTETQKEAVKEITDPKTKLRVIKEIKASIAEKRSITANKGGGVQTAPELKEIIEMRNSGDNKWLEAYKKYKSEKG